MTLDFTSVKENKTVVGGIQGEQRVKLVGFETKTFEETGTTQHIITFDLLDYEGRTHEYRTLKNSSYYKRMISDISVQLGFKQGEDVSDETVLTKATKKEFKIWIVRKDGKEYTNFHQLIVEESVEDSSVEF